MVVERLEMHQDRGHDIALWFNILMHLRALGKISLDCRDFASIRAQFIYHWTYSKDPQAAGDFMLKVRSRSLSREQIEAFARKHGVPAEIRFESLTSGVIPGLKGTGKEKEIGYWERKED